jgi:tripartite-type tricarboxylate transporter receptor subunit TctC
MSTLVRVLCLLGVLAWPGALAAQEFPDHPIRFVVPFPAGGPSDFISRVLTEKMATLLGGPIVIENRPGAGGMTGIASVAKSNPTATRSRSRHRASSRRTSICVNPCRSIRSRIWRC